jgi:hypothetical protein
MYPAMNARQITINEQGQEAVAAIESDLARENGLPTFTLEGLIAVQEERLSVLALEFFQAERAGQSDKLASLNYRMETLEKELNFNRRLAAIRIPEGN